MKHKVILEQLYNQDQSWNFIKIVEIQSHKLKIDIRRNAYDNQSHARIERWNGSEWKLVHHKPIMDCRCAIVSYVEKNVEKRLFEIDADGLLNDAMKIVE